MLQASTYIILCTESVILESYVKPVFSDYSKEDQGPELQCLLKVKEDLS